MTQGRILILVLVAVCGCNRNHVSLAVNQEATGSIRAGQEIAVGLLIPVGQVANVLVHQFEIDIAVEMNGVSSDSTQWGDESIYVEGVSGGSTTIRLRSSAHGASQGKYSVRVVSISPRTDLTVLSKKAETVERDGRILLEQPPLVRVL